MIGAREVELPSCEWLTIICDLMVNCYFHFICTEVFTANVVTASSTSSVSANAWEESTGLLSSLIPQASGSTTTTLTDPQVFNSSTGELKLGPAPVPEELRDEAERILREQSMVEQGAAAQYENFNLRPTVPGVISPAESDLPPLPPSFKTVDVRREVERVRDGRKRIRLEPSALTSVDVNSPQSGAARARALPSICAYTLHDAGEG